MPVFHRFEDALPAWRVFAAALPRSAASSADPSDRLSERFGLSCLSWVVRNGCWLNKGTDISVAEAEIVAAIDQLFGRRRDTQAVTVAPSAWATPAAGGAAVGALLVSPLTSMWFDSKPIGLFIGGVLGAFLAVRSVAALLERPGLLAALRSATSVTGGGMVVGGMWRAVRGQSIGLFRSLLWLAVAPFLLTVLQGRLSAMGTGPATGERPLSEAEANQLADLALAVCWAHPARLPRQPDSPRPGADVLSGPVWVALSRLRADWEGGASGRDIAATCEELFQRFEEDGYEWHSVSRGRTYTAEMAESFDAFGAIVPGQPVRTQRAAVTKRGQIVYRGEIRRA